MKVTVIMTIEAEKRTGGLFFYKSSQFIFILLCNSRREEKKEQIERDRKSRQDERKWSPEADIKRRVRGRWFSSHLSVQKFSYFASTTTNDLWSRKEWKIQREKFSHERSVMQEEIFSGSWYRQRKNTTFSPLSFSQVIFSSFSSQSLPSRVYEWVFFTSLNDWKVSWLLRFFT